MSKILSYLFKIKGVAQLLATYIDITAEFTIYCIYGLFGGDLNSLEKLVKIAKLIVRHYQATHARTHRHTHTHLPGNSMVFVTG